MVEIIDVMGKLVITPKTREWCKLPYPRHPNGCPNYGNNPECPPQAPLIQDWMEPTLPHWFIVTEFDLDGFAERMKKKHPNWSDKQCRCVLYWQNTVRKDLRNACKGFIKEHPGAIYTLLPEAMGVNVIITAKHVGVPIKNKPNGTVFKIALVGFPKLKLRGKSKIQTLLDV